MIGNSGLSVHGTPFSAKISFSASTKARFKVPSRWSGGGKCASMSLSRRGAPQTIVACQNPAPSPQGFKVRIAFQERRSVGCRAEIFDFYQVADQPPVDQVYAKLPSLRRLIRDSHQISVKHIDQSPVLMIKSEQLFLQPACHIGGYYHFSLHFFGSFSCRDSSENSSL